MSEQWKSSGIAAHDRQVLAHQARLECIQEAINQLGRLRSEWAYTIDQLPAYVNDARVALWQAYHAERKRGEELYEWQRKHTKPSAKKPDGGTQ